MNRHWLARVAVSALVRRVVYVLIALALAYVAIGEARAGDAICMDPAEDGGMCDDKAQAVVQAMSRAQYVVDVVQIGDFACRRADLDSVGSVAAGTKANADCSGGWYSTVRKGYPAGVLCADPAKEWYAASETCGEPLPTEEDCLNRNDTLPSNAVLGSAASGSCVDGCVVGAKPEGDLKLTTYESGAVTASIYSGEVGYTGETCSSVDVAPDFTKPQECVMASDGQTMCVKPDGQHCYATSAANATQHCWRPGEVGIKIDGPDIQKREPGDKVASPTPPTPPEGDTVSQVGDPKKSTTIINGDVVTTTTTNYTTGSGAEAGPPGGEPADGTSEDTNGSVGSGLGEVYEGDGRTVGDVFAAFQARVAAAPIASASTNFLTVTVAGACPTFSVPESAFWPVLTFDYHCVGPLADAIAFGSWLILAMAAFAAFRIALY